MANPTLLDMPIARDGNKNTIPTTDNGTTGLLSQQYGWQLINAIPPQQGGKAVKREDFNGALYLLSNLLFYLQKGWQFEWDADQTYYAGCVVKDPSDGKMYQRLNDGTSTTAPHSDTTNWKLWDLSAYLPLAGGTLSGDLKTSASIFKSTDTGVFDIRVGNDIVEDGGVRFIGKNQGGANAGASFLYGAKGTNPATPYVGIRTDGSLVCSQTGLGLDERNLGGSAIVAKSFGGLASYIKHASGLIYQWGMETVTANVAKEVNFPISFADSYFPQISPSQASGGVMSVARTSNTKMTVTNDTSGYIFWFAIGK